MLQLILFPEKPCFESKMFLNNLETVKNWEITMQKC